MSDHFFQISALVLGSAVVSFNAGVGVFETVSTAIAPPSTISMTLDQLTFEDGLFSQSFKIAGIDALSANWTAEISRGSEQLCVANGVAAYQNNRKQTFPPDDWAGQFVGDCGELQDGDVGIAVWSYETETGLLVNITGKIVIAIP